MTREARTGLVVVVAIGVAALASYAVYRTIRNMPVKEVEVGKAVMVIAKAPLTVGTLIKSDDVKVVPWPTTTPIQGSFNSVEKVVNRGLVERVMANEPITESKLAPIEAGGGLPPLIPPGMRAVDIRVNDVVGVAGFVFPGSRVDVLATVTLDDKQAISKLVLSDVQVLAAGTKYDQDQASQGKPVPSTVVTLSVTPADAERVALAQEKGRLMLALRNPMDVQPAQTTGVRMTGLVAGAPPPPSEPKAPVKRAPVVKVAPPPPPAAPAPPPVYTVETFRAAKRGQEVVQ